ncbi:U7 snRNA-associated Sm-like protein LSm10 [Amphibalanus amphitrite]|uniref:U7 snRNA-associated Sm-like protein LSm10 n=1 Tax=Amphibalanus amphitrite TaxID=1232801 RepID=A0A6A4VJ36_AMPAM|nr:U7 snRNA-associated Sm-like protein LSm10 [Amphibalanus amphitrite]
MDERTTRFTGQEKFFSCNTLVCLLQALKGHSTTIELRNESEVCGVIDYVDGFMNVTVRPARFTDAAGTCARFDSFFVHGRQIRYVHIPDEVSPLSAIRQQLEVNQRGGRAVRSDEADQMKRSRRTKKAQAYTRETVRALAFQEGSAGAAAGGSASGSSAAPPTLPGRSDDDADFV